MFLTVMHLTTMPVIYNWLRESFKILKASWYHIQLTKIQFKTDFKSAFLHFYFQWNMKGAKKWNIDFLHKKCLILQVLEGINVIYYIFWKYNPVFVICILFEVNWVSSSKFKIILFKESVFQKQLAHWGPIHNKDETF